MAERIGRIAVDEAVLEVLDAQMRWLAGKGQLPQVEGSMRKLFWSESAQRHYSDALDILGAGGVLGPDAVSAPLAGKLEQGFRGAVVTTVYGGASEILRDIIAERRLGLPRNRPGG